MGKRDESNIFSRKLQAFTISAEKICNVCRKDSDNLCLCSKFYEMNVEKRIETAREQRLCLCSLRSCYTGTRSTQEITVNFVTRNVTLNYIGKHLEETIPPD